MLVSALNPLSHRAAHRQPEGWLDRSSSAMVPSTAWRSFPYAPAVMEHGCMLVLLLHPCHHQHHQRRRPQPGIGWMWRFACTATAPGSLPVFSECGNRELACVRRSAWQWVTKQQPREPPAGSDRVLEMKAASAFPKGRCAPEGLQLPLPRWSFFLPSSSQ